MIDRYLHFPSTDQIREELDKGTNDGLRFAGLRHDRSGPEHFLHIMFDDEDASSETTNYEVTEMFLDVSVLEPLVVCDSGFTGVDLVVRREKRPEGMKLIATLVTCESQDEARLLLFVDCIDEDEYKTLAETTQRLIKPFKFAGKKYKASLGNLSENQG